MILLNPLKENIKCPKGLPSMSSGFTEASPGQERAGTDLRHSCTGFCWPSERTKNDTLNTPKPLTLGQGKSFNSLIEGS